MTATAQLTWEGLQECLNEWDGWQVESSNELGRAAGELKKLIDELTCFAEHLQQRESALVEREDRIQFGAQQIQDDSLHETAKLTQVRMGELVSIFSDLRDELAHQETLEQLRNEIADLRKLNARLAAELSVARGRSKQLYQAMLCQQQLLEQRGVVTDNLLHIRRLLHSHSELLAHLAHISHRSGVEPIVGENQQEDPILNGLLCDLRAELEEFTTLPVEIEPQEKLTE